MLDPWEYDLRPRRIHPLGATAGQWQTEDGRFMILRLNDPETGAMSRHWSLLSSYEDEANYLKKNGLNGATFGTRREALGALALALGVPSPG